MPADVTNREQATRLAISTIQPIALEQRHGKAMDLFTVWFGSNLMRLTIVTGGLAVTAFALPFGWAVFMPWTAINLVDHYLLRYGRCDAAPFFASPLYTGPLARSMGGGDLSWIVGLAVTSPAYHGLARRSQSQRHGQMQAAGELHA